MPSVCKVCLEAARTVVFQPCGHLVCCAECAAAVELCPLCRTLIRHWEPVGEEEYLLTFKPTRKSLCQENDDIVFAQIQTHPDDRFMGQAGLADLQKRTGGGAVPLSYLACITKQVLEGLRCLHSLGKLHRNLTPNSILYDRHGKIKLSDSCSTVSDALCVALRPPWVTYLAPERCRGDEYGVLSDIWSLGVVIHELATGRYPFESESLGALYEAVTEKPAPLLDVSSPILEDFAASCLQKDEACRLDAASLSGHSFVTEDVPTQGEFAAWLHAF